MDTCIIVMEMLLDGETTIVGSLADSVQEVIELEPAAIVPPPRMGTRVDTRFLLGVGKRDDQFILLLDLERTFRWFLRGVKTVFQGGGLVRRVRELL